jgi:uncharacterized PurR-regulated membrane protein YhhQ (DUF165 family)
MTRGSATRLRSGAGAWLVLIAFIACVPISNWLITNVGVTCDSQGPCLVPVFPGVWAPSGVLVAGAAFVLRDLVQERLGLVWAVAAILVGGLISAQLSTPSLAVASVASFLVSELLDLAVFTALRRNGFVFAVLASSVVGIAVDSLMFVYIAFGSMDYVVGQIVGKAWALAIFVPLTAHWRQRSHRSVEV